MQKVQVYEVKSIKNSLGFYKNDISFMYLGFRCYHTCLSYDIPTKKECKKVIKRIIKERLK